MLVTFSVLPPNNNHLQVQSINWAMRNAINNSVIHNTNASYFDTARDFDSLVYDNAMITPDKKLKDSSSFRLVLGTGGYARLLKPAPNLGELTLAGWVNITQFPNGVAPILTAVAPDAQTQVAFFLRHDGVGIIWGGPTSVPQFHMDQVDRHPRAQWTPKETFLHQQRKRRYAKDYSRGLGNIENIMADSRIGHSFKTWTPQSFVDVHTMGVADLEASPSDLNADIQLSPTRDNIALSNNWKTVPTVSEMLESDPQERHLEPETRIITEPSGDDDFVFFNWNAPQAPKPSIPQSPNEWSPMWHSDKEPEVTVSNQGSKDNIKQLQTFNLPDNDGAWSSQVEEVPLGPNHWNPYRIRGATFTTPKPQHRHTVSTTTKSPITTTHTTLRKTTTSSWTTRAPAPLSHPTTRPSTSRPLVPRLTTARPVPRWRTTKRPISVSTAKPNEFQVDLSHFTTPSTTTTTTTQGPPTREQSTHMPLWKLLKQPSISHTSQKQDFPTTTTTTTTPPSTITTSTTTQRSTTTRTPIKYLPRTTPFRQYVQRPNVLRASSENETEKPQIMEQKSKVSIWSHAADAHKPAKEYSHEEKWSVKPHGSFNSVSKHRPVSITPYHVQEFHRAMEGLPAVKDGDMAVVYSVPITDVDAFNAMYEQYQNQATPKPVKTTRAPIIIQEEPIQTNEDETNENQLGENNLLFKDTLSYQFPNEPEVSYDETASTGVLNEEEAVLVPTEENLPSTPSRSDIPITIEAENSWIPSVLILENASPKSPIITVENLNDHVKDDKRLTDGEHLIYASQTSQEKPTDRESDISSELLQDNHKNTAQSPIQPEDKHKSKQSFGNFDLIEAPSYITTSYKIPALENIPIKAVENIHTISSQSPTRKEEHEKTPTYEDPVDIKDIGEVSGTTPQSRPTPVKITLSPIRITTEQAETHAEIEPEKVKQEPLHLQSNNFAVFHITEDDIPIYPAQEETAEEVYSVDKLYQTEPVLTLQEDAPIISFYQEPSHLYHQQLPPEYKYEEAPRPIAYGGPIKTLSEKNPADILLDGVQFSADPQELLEKGLLPQPVHFVNSQEEADEWMQDQYEHQAQIEDRVFTVDADATINTVPQSQTQTLESTSNIKPQLDAHFKKMPYNFEPNQWYHLAFTWSGRDHKMGIYINGELAGTLDDVLPKQSSLAGGGLTILGQTLLPDLTDFDETSQFIGEMSDINMFGRRLRPEAVRALYRCRTRITASPALGWHHLSMRFYSDVYIENSATLCGA
ncbi:hypothetical protein SK128_012305 [Halocaridina rubra]|uniref:Pentraxin (PTX) domain-containing protein n=1 Tax=Halocaridina rubra TaxID=373956 RepID=A0AAN8WGQ8_HALRR